MAQSFGVSGNGQAALQAATGSPPSAVADITGADWAVIALIVAGLCVFLFRARRRVFARAASVKRER